MKKNILKGFAVAAALIIILSLPGCISFNPIIFPNQIVGSGNLETREFDFTSFNKVEVGGLFTAEVMRSDSYGVSVTIDDNLMKYLDVTLSGDTLHIGFKPHNSIGYPFHATANITMPALQAFHISGLSKGTVKGFNNDNIRIDVSGASTLNIAEIKTKNAILDISGVSKLTGSIETINADFEVSGASSINIEGSAQDAVLEVSGASSFHAAKFNIQNASVEVSGASNADVQVYKKLDVDISGASRLSYGDGPTLGSVKVTGASTLSRK
jgi:hypothetical protein